MAQSPDPSKSSVFVKYLQRILQNAVDDPNLPSGVCDIGNRIGHHEGRREADCQVARSHLVDALALGNAMQMQSQGAQRGVVPVG